MRHFGNALCNSCTPDSLVLVGAEANYPEAEYGWIEPEQEGLQSDAGPLFRVKQFWEKPPVHVAHTLFARARSLRIQS